jgi:hypothetical protein
MLDHLARHRRGQQRLPGGDGAHGLRQGLRRAVLEDEAARPGPQRVVDVLVEVEGGQDQHAGVAGLDHPLGRGDAVQDRHPDVHENDIGPDLAA